MALQFEAVNDRSCMLGEGPVYDDRRNALWYCDIVERLVLCFDLKTRKTQSWTLPSEVASIGMARSGRLVMALRHEVGMFDPADGGFSRIAEIEAERGPATRLNDGKVGPDGAFWVGTMDDSDRPVKEPIAALYRVTADGKVERKIDKVVISNGLAFSPDRKRMFHSDSRGRWIDRWDFDPRTGAISNRTRIVADIEDATGSPDGAAADMEGCYWSAGVSAARLNRFSADGKLLASYPVPVAAPTMPCFAGADMKTLFVTSLRQGRAPEMLAKFPLTGTLIVARAEVAGVPVERFADL